jgi:hypothetical protein
LTPLPFQEGDFVWCAFPERENPARPGPEHLGYALAVSGATSLSGSPSALMGYTTSQPWSSEVAPPLGVFAFNRDAAVGFGQSRAFVMDLRRLAFVPLTPAWFPRLDQPGHGIQGHAPKQQQRRFWKTAEGFLARHGEIVERLGPLWPDERR